MPPKPFRLQTPAAAGDALTALEHSSVVAVVAVAANGAIRRANGLGRRWLTGADGGAVQGLSPENWLPRPQDRAVLRRACAGAQQSAVAFELGGALTERRSVAGDLFPLPARAGEGGTLGVFCDATAETRLREGLDRGARLDALGSLTTGIAHDFNNLLTILVGNLALVTEELRGDEKQFARLKAARDAARRGGDLIRQLLAFARQEPVRSEPIQPARVISGLVPLIERALGKRIAFELDLDQSVPAVLGNSAQLESVIVNLAINARDAIDGRGTVGIRVAAANDRASGASVLIEVADDGCGIPGDLAQRVFEPFFTTKTDGRGSGLGLSMVRAYAERFSGTVELASSADGGTRVTLRFPAIAAEVDDSAAMTMPMASLPTGKERVLLLAAEAGLCSMMKQILSALGYRCTIAADLDEAARQLAGELPDLVISNGIDAGPLLASEPRRESVAVLQLVGPADDRGEDRCQAPRQDRCQALQKPFSLPDLAVAVRRILDPVAEASGPAG